MKESEIIMNLNGLAKLRGVIESYQQELDELEDQAFLNCPDLNVKRHELLQCLGIIVEKNTGLTKVIIEAVVGKGESVKGELLQAVFSKGRTTWDSKKLEGFALAHPELKELKKVGKPSVTFREVKDKS